MFADVGGRAIDAPDTTLRFLSSKRTVDDRALNRRAWDRMVAEVRRSSHRPLQVIEVGAGIGTMVERLVEWDVFTSDRDERPSVAYTGVDRNPDCVREALERLPRWAKTCGFEVTGSEVLTFEREDLLLRVEMWNEDVFRFAPEPGSGWDLLLAHGFVDLTDLRVAIPALLSLLVPGGVFLFTLAYDGGTILQPEGDPELDDLVERLYNRTMDDRLERGRPSGDSRSGRHLFHVLKAHQAETLEMGSSDWSVFPADGYPADEAFFLRCILDTIETALRDHPDMELRRLERWIRQRRAQLEAGELVFIAHQMDVLGRTPTSRAPPRHG